MVLMFWVDSLVLRSKYEEGAGLRQGNRLLFELQVGHGPRPRGIWDLRLLLLIITWERKVRFVTTLFIFGIRPALPLY